jgi:hypothetical protein
MEEMMEETLDSVDMDDELEEEADAEVDKVLFELTDGKLGQAGKVGSELPVRLRSLSLRDPCLTRLIALTYTRHRRRTKRRAKQRWRECNAR